LRSSCCSRRAGRDRCVSCRAIGEAALTRPPPSARGAAVHHPSFAPLTFRGLADEDGMPRRTSLSPLLAAWRLSLPRRPVVIDLLPWERPHRHSLGPYSRGRRPRTSCASSGAALAPSRWIRASLLPDCLAGDPSQLLDKYVRTVFEKIAF
jgi:hypothetical protein